MDADTSMDLKKLGQLLSSMPVTLLLMLLSIIGFLIVYFDRQLQLLHHLSFFSYEMKGGFYYFSLALSDYWRYITPIILHFDPLHLVFNVIWLWELGRRIEQFQGSLTLFGLALSIGLGSNIVEAFVEAFFNSPRIFGGMSGILYGLLGYCWVWSQLCPKGGLKLPKGVLVFMLIWLVLCLVGFVSLLGAGEVANAAHVSGLVLGIMIGAAVFLIGRNKKKASRAPR